MSPMEANSKEITMLEIQVPCRKRLRDLETNHIIKITLWSISLITQANSYQDRNKMIVGITHSCLITKEMSMGCLHH